MSKQEPEPKYWADRQFKHVEDNFEKYETRIKIAFSISVVAFPTLFSLLATLPEGSPMNPVYVFGMAISFWTMIVGGLLLYRNSSRSEGSRRLKGIEDRLANIETAMTNLATTVNDLVTEMRQERNERNDSNRTNKDKV